MEGGVKLLEKSLQRDRVNRKWRLGNSLEKEGKMGKA